MRVVRVTVVAACMLLAAGCSCKAGKVGPEDGANIPIAEAGSILKDVHFAFDSESLDSVAKQQLQQNAAWLKQNPSVRVQVEGHADERGTAEYNLALGERRARSVLDYVRSLGVEGSRMGTVSYGEELPLDPASTESAWAKNRRAHFAVVQ